MKRFIRLSVLLVLLGMLTLQVYTGCDYYNPKKDFRRYLCSVRKDGTGFRRILMNDYSQTPYTKYGGGEFKNYLFQAYPGNDNILLIFSDKIQLINREGRLLRTITNSLSLYDMNVAYSPDPDKIYYNDQQYLYRVDLTGGVSSAVYYNPDYPKFPMSDPGADIVTTIIDTNRVAINNFATDSIDLITLPETLWKACYLSAPDLILYVGDSDVVFRCSATGTNPAAVYNGVYGVYEQVMLPVLNGTKFLTVSDVYSDTPYRLLLVDIASGVVSFLGNLNFHNNYNAYPYDNHNYAIEVCRNQRDVYYTDNYAIYCYDLIDNETTLVMATSDANYNAQRFTHISSCADGETIYFICELYGFDKAGAK